MALQLNLTLDSGINCPVSYARIQNVSYDHVSLIAEVYVWATAQARLDNLRCIKTYNLSLPWTDAISLAGIYTALKTMPEFTGAIDV